MKREEERRERRMRRMRRKRGNDKDKDEEEFFPIPRDGKPEGRLQSEPRQYEQGARATSEPRAGSEQRATIML